MSTASSLNYLDNTSTSLATVKDKFSLLSLSKSETSRPSRTSWIDNVSVNNTGINSLLNEPDSATTRLTNHRPIDNRQDVMRHLVGCDISSAILLLSDIELELSRFLSDAHKPGTPLIESTSNLLAFQHSCLGSMTSSEGESESETVVESERVVQRCIKALLGLLCLVQHSRPVRQAVLRISQLNNRVTAVS